MNPALNSKLEELRRQLREAEEEEGDAAGLDRLKSAAVGYMELPFEAKGFVCGSCEYFKPEDTYCKNEKVRTTVSGGTGCCNLFYPVAKEPLPPERWKAKMLTKELKGSKS